MPIIPEALRRTGPLVIPVTKCHLSKRKGKHEPDLVKDCLELNQDSAQELKSMRLVMENRDNIPGQIGKTRSTKNRPSQTRREALAKRKERAKWIVLHQTPSVVLSFFALCLKKLVSRGLQKYEFNTFPTFIRWILVLEYLKRCLKLTKCFHRLKFLS